ncbi:MAG: bifunctional diaminohydroxyphosphoribosylaminopyrimidine deaminase/5-amino-6-(5-phosphoribosylamino)uracil reductase RibD [Myxococcales bacterium]|nr:bifunctional diaminohydroxyphosphoribosylaminopyrimidine deaminase/5-amino-6-(5-phosphoribosylamino)uracil reductase RibD [Myxococcales bacterium]
MGLALDLARRALGRTAPNPPVGALVVQDGVVVGEGWTQPPGQPHAESEAIAAALRGGGWSRGGTMYITLEPCCHHGRTPPCTDAILAAGVARVVVGTVDPFPLVAGKGIAQLRAAGLDVEVGVREEECRRLMLGFIRAHTEGLPEVTLKAAITLDGRIASASGESRWITGPAAREMSHRLRDQHDVIVVGVGTVLSDDPVLTTRIAGGRDAVPVVLDSTLRTPAEALVLQRGTALVYCADDAPQRRLPATVIRLPRGGGGVDVRAVARDLAGRGLHRVLVDGGAQVHRSFLDAGLCDRIELFINARVLAGGPGFVAGEGYRLAQAPAFHIDHVERVGDDLRLGLERG